MRYNTSLTLIVGVAISLVQVNAQAQHIVDSVPVFQSSFTWIGVSEWGTGGAAVAVKGNAMAIFSNPAAINAQHASLHFEAGKRTQTDYPLGLELDNQVVMPAAAVFSMSAGSVQFAAAYANSYNHHLEDRLLVGIDPQAPAEVVDFEMNDRLHSFLLAASRPIFWNLQVGITVGLNHFRARSTLSTSEFGGSGNSVYLGVGAQVKASERLRLGAAFRHLGNVAYSQETGSSGLLPPPTADDPRLEIQATRTKVEFPSALQLGAAFELSPRLTLLAMTEYQKWSAGRDNQLQFHAGAEWRPVEQTALRVGYFSQRRPDANQDIIGPLDQHFLTFGLSWSAMDFTVSASMLDAHVLSENVLQQSYFMVGVAYGLGLN